MPKIPIFRAPFRHPQLARLGVANGHADASFLAQVAANTNLLIAQKRHVPPIKQTHNGAADGLARGWTNGLESDGRVLFADVDLTEKGRAQVAGKELRFVSASFRRDFALTGEPEGEKLPGCYLDHVALLGDENPAVRGLGDLSEVAFDESGDGRAWITENDTTGEVTYFAEFSPTPQEETDQMNEKEMQAQIDKLAADFAEATKRADAAEAKLAEIQKAQADAKRAEFSATVAAKIKAAKNITAEKAIELTAMAETVYGNEVAEAAFSELLANIAPADVPTADDKLPPDPKAKAITAADFAAANKGDLAASEKCSAAFYEAKAKQPDLTFLNFAAQFAE